MRRSRALWLTFSVAIVAAMIALPIGIARSRSDTTPAAAASPAAPVGWAPFTPDDGSFQIDAPGDARTSSLTTGIGLAQRVEFDGGSLSVTWLAAPSAASDAEALRAGEESLLRPLVGRVADEEVDLVDDGHVAEALGQAVGGTSYDVRLFAANGRLFQVVGQAPAGSPQMADAVAFVDSFQLA